MNEPQGIEKIMFENLKICLIFLKRVIYSLESWTKTVLACSIFCPSINKKDGKMTVVTTSPLRH